MIFSFSEKESHKINFEIKDTDIFCFFHSESSINVPAEFWFHAIASSLKLKRNVLILEENLFQVPVLNSSQRWLVGDKFLWLAPRSLSVLFEVINTISISYPSMKAFLNHSK